MQEKQGSLLPENLSSWTTLRRNTASIMKGYLLNLLLHHLILLVFIWLIFIPLYNLLLHTLNNAA